MSQKKNGGRKFTVDLDDDDDDEIDFGSEDDFDNMEDIHYMSLAEIFARDDERRAARQRQEAENRRVPRAQTQENTLSNSGINFLIYIIFLS